MKAPGARGKDRDLWMLGGAALAIVAALLFIEVAGEFKESSVAALDKAVLMAFRDPSDPRHGVGPSWLADTMRDITALGSWSVVTLVGLGVTGYLALRRTYHAIGLTSAALVGGWALNSALKGFFARPRPDTGLHLALVHSPSFPSGHAMLSAITYLTLGAVLARLVNGYRLKAYFIGAGMVLTGLVGFSRVYLGVHYPTDVLGGWLAGVAWAMVCWTVTRLLQRRGAVGREVGDSRGQPGA